VQASDLEGLFGVADINLPCDRMRDVLARKTPGAGGDGPVLLDVREEWEHRYVRFPGSIHIPLSRLPENLDRLTPLRSVIVYCHTGIRSLLACYLLSRNGFQDIKNLDGGIDAYARTVDPRLPRYRLEPGRRPPAFILDLNARRTAGSVPHPWGEGVTEPVLPE
jgi:rhodanese-related sulfurtransferase